MGAQERLVKGDIGAVARLRKDVSDVNVNKKKSNRFMDAEYQ